MKTIFSLCLAAVLLVFPVFNRAMAAPDDSYQANDLMLFFLNPTGSDGNDRIVLFSLGSTWSVFRRAATPSDPTYGTVIGLGNINEILTTAYDSDWTGASSTLFMGAAGNNGTTIANVTSPISNGDYPRTAYVTKPRLGAGIAGQANSSIPAIPSGNSSGTASAINGANSIATTTNVTSNPANLPDSGGNGATGIVSNNPFTPTGAPATAYQSIQNGVIGATTSGAYSVGSISNVVNALDLYRVTPSTNGATAWQNVNEIEGVLGTQGYFLGTITLSSDGEVNFVARSDEAPVTDDYTAWAAGYPGADLTDKEGDYDRDGFKNVAEYAFGTDPTVGNSALSSATAVSNNLIVGFFRRSTDNDQAPAYSVLSSTDLRNTFTNIGASISILTNSAPPGYQAASFTQPVSGSKVFYRIEATLPQDN